MDRLTPLDDWFLAAEDGIEHMHMALVLVLDGPCPTLEEARSDLNARMDRIPRYRQRVVRAPLEAVSPVWADDPDFDIANHVRLHGLRRPGDRAALAEVVAEAITDELNRTHPLWDLTMVDGLDDGRWVAIIRVHHSLTDGVGGAELAVTLVDLEPDAAPPTPSDWTPRPTPSPAAVLVDGVARRLHPVRTARSVADQLRSPGPTLERAREVVAGLVSLGHDLPLTPHSVLNGPLGPARTWAMTTVSLDDVDRIRSSSGATVNDVALTAIAGGIAALLREHGESVTDRDVRSLVPVNLRDEQQDGLLHNRVAAMVATLPVGVDDPVARLAETHARMLQEKASHEADATAGLIELSEHVPHLSMAAGFRIAIALLHHVGQRSVNVVTTNVPGSPVPLYWRGRRIREAHPVVPIGERVRLGVAIHSYERTLSFGVTADRAHIPDVGPVIDGIDASLRELLERRSRSPSG